MLEIDLTCIPFELVFSSLFFPSPSESEFPSLYIKFVVDKPVNFPFTSSRILIIPSFVSLLPLIIVGAVYLIIIGILSECLKKIEKKYDYYK